jgi:S-adenosylmethionine:tRNA ribosyltransferase-isomerase
MMRTDELDFRLPPELIAQAPAPQRSASRLLHYRRADRSIHHRHFSDIASLLRPGDLLVFNDAKVLPARFMLRKDTGGLVEALFLSQIRERRWNVLLKNLGSYGSRPLACVDAPEVLANVVRSGEGGEHEIEVSTDEPAASVLARVGRMPLPPYIRRDKGHDARDDFDRERYQTVYAAAPSAVAAPTAGLHFTPQLLRQLDEAGVERAFLTLHVGMGTFKPVTAETLEDHVMHSEAYTIPPESAVALNRAQAEGRRIIAVGTTSARVLESQPAGEPFVARTGETSIFIYPAYDWRHVGAMITNFHLPRSTLIAMIAALVGLEEQRRIYRLAVEQKYRFFSYGDAMLIE